MTSYDMNQEILIGSYGNVIVAHYNLNVFFTWTQSPKIEHTFFCFFPTTQQRKNKSSSKKNRIPIWKKKETHKLPPAHRANVSDASAAWWLAGEESFAGGCALLPIASWQPAENDPFAAEGTLCFWKEYNLI